MVCHIRTLSYTQDFAKELFDIKVRWFSRILLIMLIKELQPPIPNIR